MHQDVNANSKGSLLNKMEVESDSDVPEFSLPPKSIVKRPKKTIRKRYYIRIRLYSCLNLTYIIVTIICYLFAFLELGQDGESVVKHIVVTVVLFYWHSFCVLVY